MEDIDFKNNRTKKIHEKLLKIDKGEYQKYLYNTVTDFFDGGNNRKPNNTRITFDCFQAIELYNRTNKRKIERIFSKFASLCRNNEGKYRKLKNIANENVQKIVDKIDQSYTANLMDFRINCNLKYVSHITMTLDCMGPNLLRIIFNCWLSDLAKYKYWLYACPNVLKELEIKREYHIGKQFLNFFKMTGTQRKRIILQKHTHNIYKEINKYLSAIAPGIFANIYKKIPCTMVANYYSMPEFIITKYYSVYVQTEHTKFYDAIITSTGKCDRYIDKKCGNAFIPLNSEIMPGEDIIMKYFGTNNSLPADKAWINIIHYILYDQNKLIEMLKNDHYENDIYGKTLNIRDYKKKMSKIVPLLSLINSSYGSEVYSFMSYDERNNEYVMDLGDEIIISFYSDYRKKIEFLLKNLEKEVISVKEIYLSKFTEVNSTINKRMFWIAAFMALMAVIQLFLQCHGNIGIKQPEIKIPEVEKDLKDDTDCTVCSLI